MTESTRVLKWIRREAEGNESTLRWVEACAAGDEMRQGDVYLYPLRAPPEVGASLGHYTKQIAPGSTTGSRHVILGEADIYARKKNGPLDGPYVHAHERVTLTHPEHAHISLPAGWYEVRYQRDYEEAPHFHSDVRPVYD